MMEKRIVRTKEKLKKEKIEDIEVEFPIINENEYGFVIYTSHYRIIEINNAGCDVLLERKRWEEPLDKKKIYNDVSGRLVCEPDDINLINIAESILDDIKDVLEGGV